ncbi:MAG TPA: hypothetical protein VL966_18640 [Alphaproteobacteria bacterium]|jgi:hypothetical protein|nr:hypothetical protein [Alphaproteobacteria bacterium]
MQISKAGHPITTVDDWRKYAPPKSEIHWKDDRSAKELAKSWLSETHRSMPGKLIEILRTHPDTASAVLESAEPEVAIQFDSHGGEPRNADLAIRANTADGPLAITIEAKSDEPFDKLVSDVLADAIDRSLPHGRGGGVDRVRDLALALLPPRAKGLPKLGKLRYQLLTATAGTLAWARSLKAPRGVLIIHEFHTKETLQPKLDSNARDLNNFIARLTGGHTATVAEGRLIGPIILPGHPSFDPCLYIGKIVERLSLPQRN